MKKQEKLKEKQTIKKADGQEEREERRTKGMDTESWNYNRKRRKRGDAKIEE